ncbi:RNA polymerase sigma factor [Ponticaulis profundi]|uniref:RNA polymerase sigma factor n=1 Tax=Ponticaulis profundi TaxID=2665222 RepID=A0ABW1SCN5_9PROT
MSPAFEARSTAQFHPDFVKRLRRYVGKKTDSNADRDDIVQETLARIIARMSDGALAEAEHEPYAFRVASNLIVDGYRRGAKGFVGLSDTLVADTPGPDQITHAKRELESVQQVIQGMPKLRRQVFVLARVEGKSQAEISERLGISQKAIEKHITRALAELVKARREWQKDKSTSLTGGRNA